MESHSPPGYDTSYDILEENEDMTSEQKKPNNMPSIISNGASNRQQVAVTHSISTPSRIDSKKHSTEVSNKFAFLEDVELLDNSTSSDEEDDDVITFQPSQPSRPLYPPHMVRHSSTQHTIRSASDHSDTSRLPNHTQASELSLQRPHHRRTVSSITLEEELTRRLSSTSFFNAFTTAPTPMRRINSSISTKPKPKNNRPALF